MRILGRLVALAVSLGLVVGGALVAVEIVVAELGAGPWVIPYDRWYLSARKNAWSSASARTLFLAMAGAGLVLLVLQVVKRRPRSLPLEAGGAQHTAAVRRRGLERSLVRAVTRVDGVATAKARVSEKRARVTASSNRRLPGDLEQRVTEAARQRLAAMKLARPPEVAVRLQHRGDG
ncbi:MAG: DUF6286 domain-containing protein [Actinomycetota bacterium]|nr:DUF6286 domain-containing protein [Actinomycetota bacterium]